MNKNDLRFLKSEMTIKNAYIKLKTANVPVKVKDLCEYANINKTTFYCHYETMEQLHRQVCHDFVAELLDSCGKIHGLLENPKKYIYSIHNIFSENSPRINSLYGSDLNALVNDVENDLLEHELFRTMDEKTKLKIRFCVGGAFHLLVYETDRTRIDNAIRLCERVLLADNDL